MFGFRQLCILLNAEEIYTTLAQILLQEKDLKFAGLMVEQLNMILLTSSELYELRTNLKDLNDTVRFRKINGSLSETAAFVFQQSSSFFCCLYETWSHNPVATVALCLLTQSYAHVCDLIRMLYPFLPLVFNVVCKLRSLTGFQWEY